ncbi:MAG: FmdB family zinc ribbon protein [Nitriliruptoraceae bacterium]
MPTYEYACRDCGEHLEVVQSFKDDSLTVCPACQGSLRKVFSAAGIIFKGSGWHIKDYASSSSRGGASASSGESDSGDAGKDSTGSKDSGSSKDSTSSGGADESTGSKSKSAAPSSKGDEAASA